MSVASIPHPVMFGGMRSRRYDIAILLGVTLLAAALMDWAAYGAFLQWVAR